MQCIVLSNPMQHNGNALTIRYSAEAKKLKILLSPTTAMTGDVSKFPTDGNILEWSPNRLSAYRSRKLEGRTMRCEGGRGGTQRLFRKMSSSGKVVDLFQMEWNGMVKYQNC